MARGTAPARPTRCWAVIPARRASSRLPCKVLAAIGGQPMLAHVWRRVVEARCADRVLIATDDDEIASVMKALGAEVAKTGPAPSGTHRVALAVGDAPVAVLNVQGDQPFVQAGALQAVAELLERGAPVATACAPLTGDPSDRARVKVQVDASGRATAFSREPLAKEGPHLVHIGIYGFSPGWLERCVAARLPEDSPLRAQDLEQLAWLSDGIEIQVATVPEAPLSVDTPDDLARARATSPGAMAFAPWSERPVR